MRKKFLGTWMMRPPAILAWNFASIWEAYSPAWNRSGSISRRKGARHALNAPFPLGRVGWGDIPGAGGIAFVDGRSISDSQLAQALGTPGPTISDPKSLGAALHQANCAIAARSVDGLIITTRPDALLGGILYCSEGLYRTQAVMYGTGCAAGDTACLVRVINDFKPPTIITGDSRAPYPEYVPEVDVLPALTNYRVLIEITPGEMVHVWVPKGT
jgi:hypothetical protein